MNFSVKVTPEFAAEAKKLSKKYHSLKNDINEFAQTLTENPMQGTPLGKNAYKVRLSIASKGKGKSGGARIITCVKIIAETVYLVSIYDKSNQESISDKELKERVDKLLL